MDRIVIENLIEIAKDKYDNRETKYCKGEISCLWDYVRNN